MSFASLIRGTLLLFRNVPHIPVDRTELIQSLPNGNQTSVRRSIQTRTINDNTGDTFQWTYVLHTAKTAPFTNTVKDSLGNDSDHVFTDLGAGSTACSFYETSEIEYKGSGAGRQRLKQIDTRYASTALPVLGGPVTELMLGNVFAKKITTTLFPSNKVSQILKTPDPGLGPNLPNFGATMSEQDFDWGQGAPGTLLRET